MESTSWRKLQVWNNDVSIGRLGDLVDAADNSLRYLSGLDVEGSPDWIQHYLTDDDEEPDWDTPRSEVNWAGFAEALAAAKQRIAVEEDA